MFISSIRTIITIIAIFAFSITESHAGQVAPQHIKLLFGYRFPPFYTVTSKKEPSKSMRGIFIDMLEDFQEQHPKYKLEYKCLPRARISKKLLKGEADAYALTDPIFISPRAKSQYGASLPMWTMGDHLLVRTDSPITKTDLRLIFGKTIAVLHGNSYEQLDDYFEQGLINKHAVYSTKQILELLLKNRVDAAICNKSTLPGLVEESHHSMDEFRMLEKPLYTFRLHLLVHHRHSSFLHDFNEFIKNTPLPEIQEEG